MEKTKDYGRFIFRSDNREKIDYNHVRRLITSIKARNMLDMRPVNINKKWEILDGQHRVLAAKELGVDIYYTIEESIDIPDIILLNTSKSWGDRDYMNYYLKHDKQEYAKLNTFIVENKIELRVALSLTMGSGKNIHADFRAGNYQFEGQHFNDKITLVRETIAYIIKMNGTAGSQYTKTSRFWKALIKLFMHPDFDEGQWKSNLNKLVNRVSNKVTLKELVTLFYYIYNYKSHERITMEYE